MGYYGGGCGSSVQCWSLKWERWGQVENNKRNHFSKKKKKKRKRKYNLKILMKYGISMCSFVDHVFDVI